jgi:hypothetical protein
LRTAFLFEKVGSIPTHAVSKPVVSLAFIERSADRMRSVESYRSAFPLALVVVI